MSQGFYEMLGVSTTATPEAIRSAFQGRLASLVRRLKAARKQGADVSLLESQERSLREAVQVLSDPARRRRYNAFLGVVEDEFPSDASELWERCRSALMDPVTVTALDVLRTMTDLPITDGLPELPPVEVTGSLPRTPPAAPAQPEPTAPPPLRVAPSLTVPPSTSSAAAITMPPPSMSPSMPPSMPPSMSPPTRIEVPILATLPEPEEETPESLHRRLGYDGRFLKAVRELRGMSIDALSHATRISRRYLEAIEDNGFERLPAATFVRGYVKEIVRELDIEHTDALQGYMDLFKQNR
jgi:hypothetical protein